MSAADHCPGPRQCLTRGGVRPCREHACRVCGSFVLADTEDWPAPLCIAHAPEQLIDTVIEMRVVLERMVVAFDGAHEPDCAVWRRLGRVVSDFELSAVMKHDGCSVCSCGHYARREAARLRFHLETNRETLRSALRELVTGRVLS